MLGSIKAALASVAVSIKSSIPAVVAATTATVLTGSTIYYITIKDGIYEKGASNVRYVLEQYINEVTIDSIVENGRGGYAYTMSLDTAVEDIVKKLKEAGSNIGSYTGNDYEENILRKLIKAEIITQYPDLRSESEIRANNKVGDNELQGGIRIVRKDTEADTTNSDVNDITYTITDKDQILTYIPYEEFKNKITNRDGTVKDHFSIKPSSVSSSVAGNFVVKTDAPNAAPVLTKEQVKEAISNTYSGDAVNNLNSAVDAFMKIQ